MRERYVYDIEVYKNYFCVGLKIFGEEKRIFLEISEEQNNIHEVYQWFNNYKGFLISFNGVHYDNMVIKYLLLNYDKLKNLNWANITSDLKWFSDKIINDDFDDDIKTIKYYKVGWTDVDLFLYWSKMLRISKKISLKSLGVQLGYDVIQELPYKPNTILKVEDLPKLRHYNQVHDLGILELLCKEMEDDIKLRSNISVDYQLDCWSWDAPKIASEALLSDYCKITGRNIREVRGTRFNKNTMYLNEVLEEFDPGFTLPIFQNLFSEILNSKDSFSKDLHVQQGNTNIMLTYGIGGLHSVNKNEQYFSNDEFQVVTSDVASLYPNLIINYQCIRFPEVLNRYIRVKDERIIAKKAKQKEKDTFFKLILNSTSGLLDNQHSWLYYPEGAMKLRLIGQLVLTKFIEVCLINNWQVVSANTDGIEVIVPRDQLQKYETLLNEACSNFNLDLEHEYYNKIIYKNVNNYLALTESNKVKRKGLFLLDFNEEGKRETPLGNSVDEIVISKALNAYYTKGISIRDFISNPEENKLHIYDFCKSNKISRNFVVYHNNEVQQNLNRYYFTRNAPYLYKQKDGNGTLQHVNVNEGITLFNTYEEKSWENYNINYSYYISKANKIIEEINNLNQLSLF